MLDTLSLPALAAKLRKNTDRRVTYNFLYRKVVDGDLPAEQTIDGRWRIKCEDIPAITAKLGFTEGKRP